MPETSDNVNKQIYRKIEHIVDNVYRSKGISSENIKSYFLIKKNFKNLISNMSDLKFLYDNLNHEIYFEDKVKDILFKRILSDRIYYEKDNPQNENLISKYFTFISKNS